MLEKLLKKLVPLGKWVAEATSESPRLGKALMKLASRVSGRNPLVCAAGLGHTAALKTLLEKQNVDLAATYENNFTLLHYAASEGCVKTFNFLLDAGANVNATDKNDRMPLHIAFFNGHSEIIKLFLEKNLITFETAFRDAISIGNLKIVEFLIENESVFNPSSLAFKWHDDKTLTRRVKEVVNLTITKEELAHRDITNDFGLSPSKKLNKAKKQAIMAEAPLLPLQENKSRLTVLEAMGSQTYYEEPNEQHAKKLKERITECSNYQEAPTLAPFMYLLALAAVGKHTNAKKSSKIAKPLKIIVTSDADIGRLKGFTYSNATGGYSNKNTLFNSSSFIYSADAGVRTIFHEAAHFAALEIMENNCEPYRIGDSNVKQQYLNIVQEIKGVCTTWESKDSLECKIINSIKVVFSDYSERKQGLELFVKIAETIGLLGYEKGYAWLQKHVPKLLAFYENHFNPACMAYLKKHKVWEHIVLDSEFAKLIGAPEIIEIAEQTKEADIKDIKIDLPEAGNTMPKTNLTTIVKPHINIKSTGSKSAKTFSLLDTIISFFKNLWPKKSPDKYPIKTLEDLTARIKLLEETLEKELEKDKNEFEWIQEKVVEPKVTEKLNKWSVFFPGSNSVTVNVAVQKSNAPTSNKAV